MSLLSLKGQHTLNMLKPCIPIKSHTHNALKPCPPFVCPLPIIPIILRTHNTLKPSLPIMFYTHNVVRTHNAITTPHTLKVLSLKWGC
jgi:hypothetical protein